MLVDFVNVASGSDPCFSKTALTILVAGTSFRVNVFFAPSLELTLAFRLPDDLLRQLQEILALLLLGPQLLETGKRFVDVYLFPLEKRLLWEINGNFRG